MSALLWWSGITMDTPMSDIGWVYVVVLAVVVVLTRCLWLLCKVDDR